MELQCQAQSTTNHNSSSETQTHKLLYQNKLIKEPLLAWECPEFDIDEQQRRQERIVSLREDRKHIQCYSHIQQTRLPR